MNRFYFDRLLSKRLQRRSLIVGVGGLTGLVIAQNIYSAIASQETYGIVTQPRLSDYPFKLGVTSGDPLPDGVVLWTRLAPALRGGGMPIQNSVQWQVAADERMQQVLKRGTVIATPEFAHSVHVDVQGLQPGPGRVTAETAIRSDLDVSGSAELTEASKPSRRSTQNETVLHSSECCYR